MKLFGILGLVITVAIAGWWLGVEMGPATESVDGEKSTYQEAIDSAEEAALKIEDSVSLSGKAVFVYDGISVPDDTKVLDLSNRDLSGSLKAEIRELTQLGELNLSNNSFTGLPAEVGQLSQLEVLNLSNNPFTGLPLELGNFKNLKTLDLRGTNYAEVDLLQIKSALSSTVVILTD